MKIMKYIKLIFVLLFFSGCSNSKKLFLGGSLDESCVTIEIYQNEDLVSKENDTCLTINPILGFSYEKKIETEFSIKTTIKLQLPDTTVYLKLKKQDLFCDYEYSKSNANYGKFACRKLKKGERFY